MSMQDAQQPVAPAARPKVIIITGPTAVGKSGVGLGVALALGGEVVSADSVQVYRGLDVGSDKLPVAQRRGVPHHLIDVLDVEEEFSAGRFHDDARAAMRGIVGRGRTPVVVGGTGFYLRVMQEGKPQGSRATPEVADAVKQEVHKAWQAAADALGVAAGVDGLTAAQKWDSAVALLGAWGDPDAMRKIAPERNNYYRLERALAVLHMTGRKRAELVAGAPQRARQGPAAPSQGPQGSGAAGGGDEGSDEDGAADGAEGQGTASTSGRSAEDPEFDFRPFFLHRDRELLYRRCDSRAASMVLGLGLLDEAALLLRRGVDSSAAGSTGGGSMAGRAVGYRQAMNWLMQVAQREAGATRRDVCELVDEVSSHTHKLVRLQMTWFRDDGSYKWVDLDALDAAAAAPAAAGGTQGTPSGLDAAVATILAHAAQPQHEGGCAADSGRLAPEQVKRLTHRGQPGFRAAVDAAAAAVAAAAAGKPAGDAQGGSGGGAGASSSGAAAGAGPALYAERPAAQLLAEVDAAAAHVNSVLLPQLRASPDFCQVLAQAQAIREQHEREQQQRREEKLAQRQQQREAKRGAQKRKQAAQAGAAVHE